MLRAGLLVALLMACSHAPTKVITVRQVIHEPAPKPEIPCLDDTNGGVCGIYKHPFDTLTET